jgi:hypothetical protein
MMIIACKKLIKLIKIISLLIVVFKGRKMMFESVFANGDIVKGYPIGDFHTMQGVKLTNPQKVIVSLPKIFIFFTSNDQEDGMVSLSKEAGFTITAKDRNIGITTQDVVEQVPRIIKLIIGNPEVFNMRPWCNYDNLMIREIWHSATGHFEMFISE